MYYFIPSQYGHDRFWQTDIIPWYFSFSRLEFDDILHQLRIFRDEEIEARMILMPYNPHARYMQHRQDVLELETYSIFDAIQDISDVEMMPLHIEDLDWDEQCDFIHTPFAVVVERQHERYAHIELGSEGFISKVIYFKNQQVDKEYFYDDRGFVSSILYFDEGHPAFRAYLNVKGQWQILENQATGVIEVNPEVAHRFQAQSYERMDDLVWEFFDRFVAEEVEQKDRFIIAANPAHNQLLLEHLPEETSKMMSFFIERNHGDDLASYERIFPKLTVAISDRQDYLKRIQESYPEYAHLMHHLPSFDTRLKLGISQRVKESKIFYQVDPTVETDDEALYEILKFVSENPLTNVVFGFFNTDGQTVEAFRERLGTLVSNRLNWKDLLSDPDLHGAENMLLENEEDTYRFSLRSYYNESDFVKELEYTRLIVDLNPQPNLYTQIAGISAGIPQINHMVSEYVTHQKNGWIVSEVTELSKAAHYYLDTLKHWNEALVYSIDKIRENTGDRFIAKWESWLKESNSGR